MNSIKTNEQLIDELLAMRQQIVEMEEERTERKQAQGEREKLILELQEGLN